MVRRIFITFLSAAALLSADTLVLRNGNRIDGSYLGGDNRSIRFASGSQVTTYYLSDVESIRFNSSGSSYPSSSNYPAPAPGYQQQSSYPQPSNYPPPDNNQQSQSNYPQQSYPQSNYPQSQQPAAYAAPAPAPSNTNGSLGIQVPAGTNIVVRLIDPVNSETDRLGQTYRASLDQPVIVNGQTVIPRGVDVIAALVDSRQGGRIEGRTTLTLDLRSVTVNGKSYDVTTTGVAEASGSRGKRSAEVIGGTAALGAIIGAVAGGGRGAAIGAGSGAAVGTAAEVMTAGPKVKVPSETRLTFTLQNPLNL